MTRIIYSSLVLELSDGEGLGWRLKPLGSYSLPSERRSPVDRRGVINQSHSKKRNINRNVILLINTIPKKEGGWAQRLGSHDVDAEVCHGASEG